MNKITKLVLGSVVALSMVGCGSNTDSKTSTTASDTGDKTKISLILPYIGDQSYFDTTYKGLQLVQDELGDKVEASDKENIEKAIGELKEVKDGDDVAKIKEKTEALTHAFYSVSEKIYKQQGAQGGQTEQGAEDVVDADYEVVDEDEENK